MDPLTAALIGGGLGFGASQLFGGKKDEGGFQERPLTADEKKINKLVLQYLSGASSTTYPLREIEGMTDLEGWAQGFLEKYAKSPAPGTFDLSKMLTAGTALGGYTDITKAPYFEPVVSRITREGDERVNQLRRTLQKMGMSVSSPASKLMGKEVGRTVDELAGTLAPYYMAERGYQESAINRLLGLAGFEEQLPLTRLGAVETFGALPRNIQQMIKDAVYKQKYEQGVLPLNLAGLVSGRPVSTPDFYRQEQQPSTLTQMMPMIMSLISMSGGMGGAPSPLILAGGRGGGNLSPLLSGKLSGVYGA